MAGGRPSEYKEEYIEKADEYLELHVDSEEKQLTGLSAKGTELYKQKLTVKLPTVEGFAMFIGVNKTSLYEWEKKHPAFSNALSKIREEQRHRLLNKGLSGDYNPVIAKLILSSNHGMSDKQEIDHTTKGESFNGNKEESKKAIGEFLEGDNR